MTTSAEAVPTQTRIMGSSPQLLPRVNLLPPEIAERRTFRQVQMGLGGAVLAVIVLLALLFLSASHSVTSANGQLQSAKTQQRLLQNQSATYANVTAIYSAAADAQTQLVTAMGDEVRFSQLLNDLSLSIPSSVWVSSVALNVTPPSATPTAAAVPGTTPALGTFTVTGVGFSHDDVALWLESVAALRTYSDPFLSSSTEALLGTRKIVNWTATANLTPAALSQRYTKIGG
jgi:Tfp pilus assembly protein PilN